MGEDMLRAMALADASVHLHAVSMIQSRLASNVKSLMVINDHCMEEVNTPLGLDFDNTQTLVLATSELFRLSHDLLFRHKGLEDALAARNKQESKRKRYDRLKYSTSNWLVIAAKFRLNERRKAEIRRRAHVGRLIDNLESKNEALTERIAVLEGMLAEAPRHAFASAHMSQLAQAQEEVTLVSRDSFSDSALFPTNEPPTNSATPFYVDGSVTGNYPRMGGAADIPAVEEAPSTRDSAAAESVAAPAPMEDHESNSSAKFKDESVFISAEPQAKPPGESSAQTGADSHFVVDATHEGDPDEHETVQSTQEEALSDSAQQDHVCRSHNKQGTLTTPSRKPQQLSPRTSAVEFLQASQGGEIHSPPVDVALCAGGSTPPALQHRGSTLIDHVSGDLILDGSNPKRSTGPGTDTSCMKNPSHVLSDTRSLQQSGTQARHQHDTGPSAVAKEQDTASNQLIIAQVGSVLADVPAQGVVVDSNGVEYDLSDPFDRFHWLLTEESPRQQLREPDGATGAPDGRKSHRSIPDRPVWASAIHGDIQAKATPRESIAAGQHLTHESRSAKAQRESSPKPSKYGEDMPSRPPDSQHSPLPGPMSASSGTVPSFSEHTTPQSQIQNAPRAVSPLRRTITPLRRTDSQQFLPDVANSLLTAPPEDAVTHTATVPDHPEEGTTQQLLELLGSDSEDSQSVVSADSFGEPYDSSVGIMQRRVTAAKSLLEAEVKQRCQAQRAGGGTVTRDTAAPTMKEMEFFHSMGIAGAPMQAPEEVGKVAGTDQVLSLSEATQILEKRKQSRMSKRLSVAPVHSK